MKNSPKRRSLIVNRCWLMKARLHLVLFSLSLVLQLHLVPTVTGTSEIFAIKYSSNGNNCEGGNAIVMKGYAPNETYPLKIFDETGNGDDDIVSMTCAEQAICRVDGDSPLCTASSETTFGPFLISDTNYNDDGSSVIYTVRNETEYVYGSQNCSIGGWYPSCYYNYATIDDVKSNPSKFLSNTDQEVIETQLNSLIYVAFYEDAKCTELTTIQTLLSGSNYTLLGISNNTGGKQFDDASLSCDELSACLVDVNSAECQKTGVSFFVNTTKYTLSTTTVNNTPSIEIGPSGNVRSAQSCTVSDIIPTCYYKIFPAGYLAMYPDAINGEEESSPTTADVAESDNNSDVDIEESNEASMAPLSHVMFPSGVGMIAMILSTFGW